MIRVAQSTTYYINERALAFYENDKSNPNRVAVSVASGAAISVYDPDNGIDFDIDGSYRRWRLTGYDTLLATDAKKYIYVRLNREDNGSLIVFDDLRRAVSGGVITVERDEEGNEVEVIGEETPSYYFIKIGELTETLNRTNRTLTYDSGILSTPKGDYESGGALAEMFELDKSSTPWLIKAKQFFHSLTIKNSLTLLDALLFGEKTIKGVHTSQNIESTEDAEEGDDSYVESPDDYHLTTSRYVEKFGERYLRKDKDDRSPYKIASDKAVEVGDFVSGASGAVVYIDQETGQSVGELDKLYIRMKAYFEQLEIINVNTVGGKQILSPAGSIRCNRVEKQDGWDYYRCYFLNEQDGEKIANRFNVGDQAFSKMFNAKEGVSNKLSNRYYWRLVVGVGENYIDLSVSDCDTGSDAPESGDVICQRGNRNDVDRQNFIELSSVDSFSPSITLYQGVDNYSLADNEMVQYGVNKSTGKAFMNVYGDMYVGNRDKSSYISYTPESGLTIKGKLDVGTQFGDKTLQDIIDDAKNNYKEDYDLLKSLLEKNVGELQNQIDGAIETWFYDPVPTLTNAPASGWTTEDERNKHLGDLYYSGEGRAYRFQLNADTVTYYWNEIVDTDIVRALENAKKAQDTADGKRRVFVSQPTSDSEYDVGDMWVNATYPADGSIYKDDMLRAVVSKQKGEAFDISHWQLASKYTDDTVAEEVKQQLEDVSKDVTELTQSVKDMKEFTDEAFADGIIDRSERSAIQKYLNQVESLKAQVQQSYQEMAGNILLEDTTHLTNLTNAHTKFLTAAKELVDVISEAIEDDTATSVERAAVDTRYGIFNEKYGDYIKYLNAATKYVEEKLNTLIAGYQYLKDALGQSTYVSGGLIQTSSLVLGYKDGSSYKVMAGSNGMILEGSGNLTPAYWAGGDMIDREYAPEGTDLTDAADYMIRMDGSGYAAGGNLSWDTDGNVKADPLSFFVGEATVGGLLASFQVVLKADGKSPDYLNPQVPFSQLEISTDLKMQESSKIAFGDAYLRYDKTNNAVYVEKSDGTSVNFYATGDVSAFGAGSSGSGGGGSVVVYDGLDSTDASVALSANQGRILKGLIDSVGVGLDETALEKYLTDNEYAQKSDIPTNYYDSSISRERNTVLAAPSSSNGVAAFRNLVYADLPDTTTINVDYQDYRYFVVGLFCISDTWDGSASYPSMGTINVLRRGGIYWSDSFSYNISNSYQKRPSDGSDIDILSQSCYFSFISKSNVSRVRPCTFVYEGKKYAGVVSTYALSIYGIRIRYSYKQCEPFFVSYYNSNSGTVLNQEVYDSIRVEDTDIKKGSINMFGSVYMNGNVSLTAGNYTTYCTPASHASDSEIHITSNERTNWNSAYSNLHSHNNKDALDKITSDMITLWNAICGKMYIDENGYLHSSVVFVGDSEISSFGVGSSSGEGGGGSVVIYDGLDSSEPDIALSANQGRLLKSYIDDISIPEKLPNPKSLTFGSKSYDGSSAVSLLASDLGALTSHQSIYTLTINGNGILIDTYTPNSGSKTINITYSSVGAASASHTHNYISTVKVGSDSYTASSNMVSLPAYPTSLPNPNSLTIQLNSGTTSGSNKFVYNGSTAYTVNITPSAIGAAASSHTHLYAGSSTAGGSATSAEKLTTVNKGSASLPVYFDSNGVPIACTASSIFSGLTNSGNSLSVTVAGQTRTLTVAYATSAGSATNADTLDNYHITDLSKYIFSAESKTISKESDLNDYTYSSYAGYWRVAEDNKSYVNSELSNFGMFVLRINTGFSAQIQIPYYSDKAGMRFRSQVYTSSGNLWGSWKILLDSKNYTNYVTPKRITTTIDASSLSESYYYPVVIGIGTGRTRRIECLVSLSSGTKPSWSTHTSGFSVKKLWEVNGGGWGSTNVTRRVLESNYLWATSDPVRGIGQIEESNEEYVYVRGGGKYFFITDYDIIPSLKTSTYTTSNNKTLSPTTTAPDVITHGIYFNSSRIVNISNGYIKVASTEYGIKIKRTNSNGSYVQYFPANQESTYWISGVSSNYDYSFYYAPSGVETRVAYITTGGNFVASGEITAYSDARLKSNIKPLEYRGFITPVEYDKDGKHSIGFVAQDVQKLYPELVTVCSGKEGYLSLNYQQYTAVLQAQIIELNKRIEELEERVKKGGLAE